jgi:hypothetical protein
MFEKEREKMRRHRQRERGLLKILARQPPLVQRGAQRHQRPVARSVRPSWLLGPSSATASCCCCCLGNRKPWKRKRDFSFSSQGAEKAELLQSHTTATADSCAFVVRPLCSYSFGTVLWQQEQEKQWRRQQ